MCAEVCLVPDYSACPVGGVQLASDVGIDRPEIRRGVKSGAWGCRRGMWELEVGPWGQWEHGEASLASCLGI